MERYGSGAPGMEKKQKKKICGCTAGLKAFLGEPGNKLAMSYLEEAAYPPGLNESTKS